jgi:two-component system, LytTR family, sensor kinase
LTDTQKNFSLLHRLTPLWIGLSLWVLFAALFAVQAVVVNSDSWRSAAANAFCFWLLWMAFFPSVIWLAMRFPLERGKLLPQAGIHLIACAFIVSANQVAYRTAIHLPAPVPHGLPPPDAHRLPPESFPVGLRAAPDIVTYLVTLSVCVAFAHYRRSQERERRAIELEASLTQARLQTLRMQINPHFLFNTLNTISTLVHTNPSVADDMITDLSELFRASLENADGNEIPLSRELDLLQHYLAIEQRRFGKRLQVEQDIAPAIENALVPTLILQPLVENAIRYGIEPNASSGRIAIRGRLDGSKVKLSVSDCGAKPANALKMQTQQHGIGLANTRARLQQLYGVEQSFSIRQGELGGWIVEMELPLRPAPGTS